MVDWDGPDKQELESRIDGLWHRLKQADDGFDTVLISNRVNQYYYTGTMQDGLLMLRGDGTAHLFVRKSAARAELESPLGIVRPIASYRDILQWQGADLGRTFVEMANMSLATLNRLQKYFNFQTLMPLDGIISRQRAIKSAYELDLIRESGRQHANLMESIVPQLLREGMSEADFLADLYASMLKQGYHGVSRFSMPQLELIAGQIGFGESSIYPTNFDGPAGMRGMSAAVPLIGSRQRRLKRGDLVFVDIGYGCQGYHSDKTQVYSYGGPPPAAAAMAHQACIGVLDRALAVMRLGVTPDEVYRFATTDLPASIRDNFMGFGREKVKFLGHGTGLYIDDLPVIAPGGMEPLEPDMVIALEPKCGLAGIGMVGVEETYLVTANGPVCLTGGARDIVAVD